MDGLIGHAVSFLGKVGEANERIRRHHLKLSERKAKLVKETVIGKSSPERI